MVHRAALVSCSERGERSRLKHSSSVLLISLILLLAGVGGMREESREENHTASWHPATLTTSNLCTFRNPQVTGEYEQRDNLKKITAWGFSPKFISGPLGQVWVLLGLGTRVYLQYQPQCSAYPRSTCMQGLEAEVTKEHTKGLK